MMDSANEAFKRAALYQACKHSSILSNIKFENADSNTLVELVNQHNAHSMRELPILMSKALVKTALSFLLKRFPKAKPYINADNILVRIEEDELAYILTTKPKAPKNIMMIVLKNIVMGSLKSSIDIIKSSIVEKETAPTIQDFNRIEINLPQKPLVVSAPPDTISDFGSNRNSESDSPQMSRTDADGGESVKSSKPYDCLEKDDQFIENKDELPDKPLPKPTYIPRSQPKPGSPTLLSPQRSLSPALSSCSSISSRRSLKLDTSSPPPSSSNTPINPPLSPLSQYEMPRQHSPTRSESSCPEKLTVRPTSPSELWPTVPPPPTPSSTQSSQTKQKPKIISTIDLTASLPSLSSLAASKSEPRLEYQMVKLKHANQDFADLVGAEFADLAEQLRPLPPSRISRKRKLDEPMVDDSIDIDTNDDSYENEEIEDVCSVNSDYETPTDTVSKIKHNGGGGGDDGGRSTSGSPKKPRRKTANSNPPKFID